MDTSETNQFPMTTEKKINWFSKKENRLKCIEFPFQKLHLLILFSTAFWFLYLWNSTQDKGIENSITELLTKYWVKPILSKIGTGDIPIPLLILLAILIILFFMGKGMRRYVYSGKTIAIYVAVILNYFLLRIIDTPYNFSCFANDGFFSGVAYWDVFFLFLVPIGFYIFKQSKSLINKEKTENKNSHLIIEKEISDEDEDLLNRVSIAKQIVSIVHPIKSDKSFAVGITAPWGYGKTSFLNFLKTELETKDDEAIFIEFSPWFCKSEEDIISFFFASLASGLEKYHSSINNQIQKYAKIILSLRKNTLTESIGKALNLFEESKELQFVSDELDKHIGSLNRKVYISIDDLDRLYAKEIIECFKIIRNTANFKNIIFIVAYDPVYIENALASKLNNNHKGYIDKIIQLTFSLPRIEEFKLLDYIASELENRTLNSDDVLKHSYYKNSELKIISSNKNHDFEVSKYFTNIRDCNKILNIFSTYYRLLGDEVILSDLFLVCILKTLYPKEALEIYLNLDGYFSFGEKIQFKDTVHWSKRLHDNNKVKSEEIEPIYLIDKLSEGMHLNEREKFINLIQAIFLVTDPNLRSVARHNNFETYYNGVVSEEKIKYTDFEIWIQSTEDLINQIKIFKDQETEINKKKLKNLVDKLSHFTPQDKNQVQTMIYGLLFSEINFRSIIPTLLKFKKDYQDIFNAIIDDRKGISISNVSGIISDIKLGIIDSQEDSLYKENFKLDDLQLLSIKALKEKIATNKVDEELLSVYWDCFIERTDGPMKIDEVANRLMKEFAEANAVEFIKILEITPHRVRDIKTRAFHYSIDQIFSNKIGNYDGFEEFLKKVVSENLKDPELMQIWHYWEQYKASNYNSYELVS